MSSSGQCPHTIPRFCARERTERGILFRVPLRRHSHLPLNRDLLEPGQQHLKFAPRAPGMAAAPPRYSRVVLETSPKQALIHWRLAEH